MYTADECINILIHVITEDPSKIAESIDDAKSMIESGAVFDGESLHELMAEYLIHAIKKANPYLIESFTLHYEQVEAGIIAHLASIQK